MISLIDLIVFIFYIVSVGFLVVKYLQTKKSKDYLISLLVQAEIDKNIYVDRLAKELELKDSQAIESTDGFLNFVSQSRDWAYEYIENVQKELKEVFSTIDNSEKKTLKIILAELNKLRNLLPEEKENK
jgi:hypothetical protein